MLIIRFKCKITHHFTCTLDDTACLFFRLLNRLSIAVTYLVYGTFNGIHNMEAIALMVF
jgi:hypothetical protein